MLYDETTNTRIYTLCDPDTQEVRYVGSSYYPELRLYNHYSEARRSTRSIKNKWLKELLDQGKRPILDEIETVQERDRNERERFWINYYLEQGANLVNGLRANNGLVLTSDELAFIKNHYDGDKSRAIHDGLKLLMNQ